MIINKEEELAVLKMYTIVCEESEETLDMTRLAERIIKRERDGVIGNKTKKKDERLADSRLEKMGIVPKIYLFEMPAYPFRAITIADARWRWIDVKQIIDDILWEIFQFPHDRSTLMLKGLHEKGIYGVAICEQRNQLDRQRGRTIAKGRLWKHLKMMEREK